MATSYAAWAEREGGRLFHTAMGGAIALLVFAGYAQSYFLSNWLERPARAPDMTPFLHIHAVSFTLWILLGILLPGLVAAGRVEAHKRIGLAAAALAVLVWLFGNLVAIEAIHVGYKGLGDPYAFYSITFFSIQAFAVIVALGLWKRHDHEAHKRLMLLSNAAILEAAVGRLPLDLVVRTAPFSFYFGADLVIVAGIAHDLLTRGRIHPVWTIGGGFLVLSQLFRLAIMHTEPWLAFAHQMARLV